MIRVVLSNGRTDKWKWKKYEVGWYDGNMFMISEKKIML